MSCGCRNKVVKAVKEAVAPVVKPVVMTLNDIMKKIKGSDS